MSSDSPKTPNPLFRSRDTLEDLMDEVGHWRNRPVEDHDAAIRAVCADAAQILKDRGDGEAARKWEDPRTEELMQDWYRLVRSRQGRR